MENFKKELLPERWRIYLSKSMCSQGKEDIKKMNVICYAAAVGSLICGYYICISVVSRSQANLGNKHWIAVNCILKYLRRIKDMHLAYGNGELRVDGYIDSDFQFDVDNRKSTSEFIFTLIGGPVSWKGSKQDTTADSIT